MVGFADSIKLHSQRILEEINKKCYTITWNLFTSIVQLSPSPSNPGPYADGLLVNQWYPKVGKGFSSQLTSATSPYGSGSLSRINGIMGGKEFLKKNGTITLTNNVHYGILAEKIGWNPPEWTGRQGPYRMVARSIQLTAAKYK